MVVPVFFGIIGLIGLMGNALVIIGKFPLIGNHLFQQIFFNEIEHFNFLRKILFKFSCHS